MRAIRIEACANTNKPQQSFKETHKARVKDLIKRVQQREVERSQAFKATQDHLKKDFESFKIDTLRLLSTELTNYIDEQEENTK